MHVVLYVVAGIFAAGVLIGMLTRMSWSISTQHRDHGATAAGPLRRRWIWSRRRPAAHAGPVNPEAIPTRSIRGQTSDRSAGITDER
jgi:hypothetical protein